MKTMLGYYELSENQQKSLENAVGSIFNFDLGKAILRHPATTPAGYRHIDIIIGEKDEEIILVTEGASARKISGRPYLEAFAKLKTPNNEMYDLMCFSIKLACFNTTEVPPQYECSLFNGFEYLFIDGNDKFHDLTGYWGMFLVPQINTTISGKEYQFYQLIPAYKEELKFVEEYAAKLDYKRLCEAIINHIPNRQYFDVKDDMLAEEQLLEIYNGCL